LPNAVSAADFGALQIIYLLIYYGILIGMKVCIVACSCSVITDYDTQPVLYLEICKEGGVHFRCAFSKVFKFWHNFSSH